MIGWTSYACPFGLPSIVQPPALPVIYVVSSQDIQRDALNWPLCMWLHPSASRFHFFFLHERSSLSCLWNQAEGKTNRTSKFRTFISLLIIFTSAASTESEPSLLKDNFHLWSITDLAVLKLFWTPLFPWGFSAFGGNYSVEFRTPIRVSSSTFYGHSAVFLCGHFYWNFFFHEKLCHSAVIP